MGESHVWKPPKLTIPPWILDLIHLNPLATPTTQLGHWSLAIFTCAKKRSV
jgi:hypothetical protein